jgi:hypothetical protein
MICQRWYSNHEGIVARGNLSCHFVSIDSLIFDFDFAFRFIAILRTPTV